MIDFPELARLADPRRNLLGRLHLAGLPVPERDRIIAERGLVAMRLFPGQRLADVLASDAALRGLLGA